MRQKIDLKGKVFGGLTVIEEDTVRTNRGALKWICLCTCGNTASVIGNHLKNGNTKSCGCLHKKVSSELNTKHGLVKHPLYTVWANMKSRCSNHKSKHYKNYGGRGITVCGEWADDFMNFYEDMSVDWKKNLELDRRDNDKGYYKDNCRWITRKQNTRNKGGIRGSTSKYKGVHWYQMGNKWVSQVSKNSKRYYLGAFTCEKEAALAYNKKAKELFGEYANLNKIEN